MAILTPELLSGSIIIMVIIYVIAFAFQIYVLYLNWKQSKVNNQMKELIAEVKAIHKILDAKTKKKTKSTTKKKK